MNKKEPGTRNPEPGNHVYLNGQLIPAAEATVSVFDRAFAYGDGLFETIKVLGGQPVFFKQHCRRLRRGMEAAGMDFKLDTEELKRQAMALAEANSVSRGRLRVQVSRGAPAGAGGFDPGPDLRPTVLLTVEDFPGYPEQLYRDGIKCVTADVNRGRYAFLKSTSLLPLVLARQEMLKTGAGETILTNGHGRLLEGTFTNIFFLDGGRLFTPAEDQAILGGVTRGIIIDIAAGMDVPLEFQSLTLGDVAAGSASAFLTSSLLGVCPVREIDEIALRLDPALTGRLAARLQELELADTGHQGVRR